MGRRHRRGSGARLTRDQDQRRGGDCYPRVPSASRLVEDARPQHRLVIQCIAAILGVTAATVQKWRTHWVCRRSGFVADAPTDAQADVERRDLYLRGFSDNQIAAVLGMRTRAITGRKRAGLPRHQTTTDHGPGRVSA